MHTLLHTIAKWWLYFRYNIKVIGRENIPVGENLIVVSPHRMVVDSYLLPVVVRKKLIFMAKKEYFEMKHLYGRVLKWVLSHGAVPVDRDSASDKVRALKILTQRLLEGYSVGLHPEGTRTPTRAVYKGWPGAIDMAWKSGKRILPVVILGVDRPKRWWHRLPWPRRKITIIIGRPMTFAQRIPEKGILSVFPIHKIPLLNRAEKEVQTRQLMLELAAMAGWPYVDEYAADVKKRLEAVS